jgi:acetyl-CoA carboxylase carboxyltransferase component
MDGTHPLALRSVVPENRLRAYDTRAAIHGVADVGSVLMLREGFGVGIHTALARIEGKPVGIMANNPRHLGARSTPMPATRPRASCSCAMPMACPSSR